MLADAKPPTPTGPPEEWLIGADAKIGLGRVIKWNDDGHPPLCLPGELDDIECEIAELIAEHGYHCVATSELTGWVSLPSNMQYGLEAYKPI